MLLHIDIHKKLYRNLEKKKIIKVTLPPPRIDDYNTRKGRTIISVVIHLDVVDIQNMKKIHILYLHCPFSFCTRPSFFLDEEKNGHWIHIVLFKSLRKCKRRNKDNFTLSFIWNKIMLCGGWGAITCFI